MPVDDMNVRMTPTPQSLDIIVDPNLRADILYAGASSLGETPTANIDPRMWRSETHTSNEAAL